jgi:hypothetical protein
MLYNLTPLYHYYHGGLAHYLCYFVGDNASLTQAIKVEVMYFELRRSVYLTNSECRAGHFVLAARAAYQAAYKGGFAATQVANKFDDLTAL